MIGRFIYDTHTRTFIGNVRSLMSRGMKAAFSPYADKDDDCDPDYGVEIVDRYGVTHVGCAHIAIRMSGFLVLDVECDDPALEKPITASLAIFRVGHLAFGLMVER